MCQAARAIAINSEDAETYYYSRKSQICYQLGRKQEALESLNRALELNPEDIAAYQNRSMYADAYLYKGFIYCALSDNSQALKNFEQAAVLFKRQGDMTKYKQVKDEIKKINLF